MQRGATHYETLQVSRNASKLDIGKAYRKLAMEVHPDKVLSDEMRKINTPKFQALTEAWAVLSDDSKRNEYNKELKKILDLEESSLPFEVPETGSFEMDEKSLNELTGWIANTMRKYMPSVRDSLNQQVKLEVTLSECYYGCTKKLCIPDHQTRCTNCSGTGKTSSSGNHSGIALSQALWNMVLIQKIHSDICNMCNGNGIISSKGFIVDVVIKCGNKPGDQIVLIGKGTANRSLLGLAGDLIVTLTETETGDSSKFHRHTDTLMLPNDLIMYKILSLKEALTGFQFMYTHIDGKIYTVNSDPMRVYNEGDKILVHNRGMPDVKNGGFGNLHIIIKILMPRYEDIMFTQGILKAALP